MLAIPLQGSCVTGLQTETSCSSGLTAQPDPSHFIAKWNRLQSLPEGRTSPEALTSRKKTTFYIVSFLSCTTSSLQVSWPYATLLLKASFQERIKAVSSAEANKRSQKPMKEWLCCWTVWCNTGLTPFFTSKTSKHKKNAPIELSRVAFYGHMTGHTAQAFSKATCTHSI